MHTNSNFPEYEFAPPTHVVPPAPTVRVASQSNTYKCRDCGDFAPLGMYCRRCAEADQ